MSHTLTEIAQQIKDRDKKVQLIYAFNGSGKTRLSREFKDLIAPKNEEGEDAKPARNKILYYNAFTEDLFYWDNDLKADETPKLKIQPNSFTDWVLKDQGKGVDIVANFQHYATDKITPVFNAAYQFTGEDGKRIDIPENSEVTFRLNPTNIVTEDGEPIVMEDGNPIVTEQYDVVKISKGEESNFIWSVFVALIDQVVSVLNEPESDDPALDQFKDLEYIFIDDPVSSLDENHLIELAVKMAGLIKSSTSNLRFIVTTHSPLFYNVLYSELKSKSGYILSKFDDGGFELEEKKGAANKAFAYHLHIKNLIEQAIDQNNVQRYHFTLLRNLYEKTAAFFGYKEWADLLDTVEGDKKAYFNRIIQFSSHSRLSNEEIAEPTEPEKQTVKLLLDNLTNNYGVWPKQEGQNG